MTTKYPTTGIYSSIPGMIERAVDNVKFWLELGWTLDRALAHVKANNTLGPNPWADVLAAFETPDLEPDSNTEGRQQFDFYSEA